MQQSHRRSTKVCTRCRKRKTKCDFKFPACTPCQKAEATCLGFDPVTREAVPRSLVKSLEARVAELETKALAFRAAPENIPYTMASRIAQANLSVGCRPPTDPYLRSIVSSALLFRQSCPPLAIARDRQQDEFASGLSTPVRNHDTSGANKYSRYSSGPANGPNHVPFAAVQRMLQNYVDIHLPQYPCVPETLLESIVERIQSTENSDSQFNSLESGMASGLGHYEYFIYFIALAISSITLTWRAEHQARAASDSFFNSALRHLQAMGWQDEIRSLRMYLLLANYAHMCPQRADNWSCIANAIRIVLDLGLHKGCPESLDAEDRRQRIQLFWAAYGMERSLCTNLRLPLSFPEESITTQLGFPAQYDMATFNSSQDIEKRSSATHIYLYRGLETEVHRVLHLEEDLSTFGHSSINEWIADINARLSVWYEKAQSYTQYNMLEFKHVQYTHLRIRIHRPCPRLRTRTLEDQQIVLDSSLILIDDYLGQERRRRLFYPWHGVHILFEAAVVALDACWASRDRIPLRAQSMRMLEASIPQCVQMLKNIGERWNPAIACAERLAPIVQKVFSALVNLNNQPSPRNYNDPSITDEINDLVFSDGPLTWHQAPLGDTIPAMPGLEDENFLIDNMMLGDMEAFHWDPEWDIMPADQF